MELAGQPIAIITITAAAMVIFFSDPARVGLWSECGGRLGRYHGWWALFAESYVRHFGSHPDHGNDDRGGPVGGRRCIVPDGVLGLSAALGAFVAGVALADSEYRHELEGNIEPFKGLLMGLFFMSVGASIQFGLIVSEPVAIIGSALGLVGLKTLLLIAIGWVIGLRRAPLALFAILLGQGGEFAFVLLQATSESVVPLEIADRVNAVVALSMLSTPLLMLLYTLVLEPYFSIDANKDAEFDVEDEGSDVIVVGFGPFGQIVSRLLLLNGVKTTILDYDAEQIESLRRFGARVFYGDAARPDLLKSAGANDAKMVIVCESERDRSLAIVTMIKHHFPHLTICAQARDRGHVYELINEGVEVFERETFESALTLGEQALVGLGWKPYSARVMVEKFNKSDRDNLSEQSPRPKRRGDGRLDQPCDELPPSDRTAV